MYICRDCKTCFEKPIKTTVEILYGVGEEFNSETHIEICPNCDSLNIEKRGDDDGEQ